MKQEKTLMHWFSSKPKSNNGAVTQSLNNINTSLQDYLEALKHFDKKTRK